MTECLFCAIARHEKEATYQYEDENFVAFDDLYPKAAVHILLVPKKHIHSIDHVEEGDLALMGSMILVAKEIARQKGLDGYQLHFNVGKNGGQVIDHLHLHIMGGKDIRGITI